MFNIGLCHTNHFSSLQGSRTLAYGDRQFVAVFFMKKIKKVGLC